VKNSLRQKPPTVEGDALEKVKFTYPYLGDPNRETATNSISLCTIRLIHD
jgi:hypothetical protein